MGRTGRPAQRTLQSVEKAVALLWAFGEAQGELGVLDLARRTGLGASTVSRLLGSLVAGDLVEHSVATGRYRLGVGVMRLAAAASRDLDLRSAARRYLEALVAQTSETASLSIFDGSQALTIDFVPSPRAVVSVVHLGRPSLAHCTSVGKVLLAHQPEVVRRRVLAGPLQRFTPRTVTDPAALLAELEGIRRRGYATAEEEREPELNAVAVPVFGARGEALAALGLQGPAHRFDRAALLRALPVLQAQAGALSRDLGAPGRPAPATANPGSS